MRKTFSFLLVLFTFSFLVFHLPVRADEYDELGKKIEELKRALQMSQAATTPLEATLKNLEADIADIRQRIANLEGELKKKEQEVAEGEKALEVQQKILESRVRSLYKKNSLQPKAYSLQLLFSKNLSETIRLIGYQKSLVDEDKKTITEVVLYIKDLEEKKTQLQGEKVRLASAKEEIDKQAEFFRKEIKGAREYQTKLEKEIAELTARQKEILAARSGTFTTSVGEVPFADDPNARPDFNPGFKPAFAAFSFGAYSHRKGLSQYGAKGRAQEGQNYKEILRAYYGKEPVKKEIGGMISVAGFGDLDFNYYLLGIAEMPSSFPFEALKAQAIAARSFALRYKEQGKTICTTQACQVFLKSKADSPPDEWRRAVEETRGEIVEDVVAYYSSTTGGYLETSGWDTKCGSSSCWTDEAYEKIASSPWFYKGWYTESYRNDSAKCGRSHPWLTQEEFVDILNAWVVRQKGNSEDVSRILPITIESCSIGSIQSGSKPFSLGEMRDKANSLDGAYTSVSGVSVEYSNSGETAKVKIQTNKGELSLSGSDFKTIFNLRAPGYLSLRSPLFNIEKK